MYLKNMVYKNVGPLRNINIDMPFNDDESPKPLIIVGENGSGKTTLLSNIVDSFYEMAGKVYNDVRIQNGSNFYQYYKVISPEQISLGEEYLYSYIKYDEYIETVFKAGNYSFGEFKKNNADCSEELNWNDEPNAKRTCATNKQIEDAFNQNVICYFSADRYEKPSWLGEKYYIKDSSPHLSVNDKFKEHIPNPITVTDVTEISLQWLMDLVVDSRADVQIDNNSISLRDTNVKNLKLLGDARRYVEQILSTIINKDVYFGLNYRNAGKSRFNIRLRENNQIIIPSLDSLSTGEIVLFNIFSTIIRYADNLNINSSFNFHDIKGIVIIDEIELHLHTQMQKEVLPKLVKLFPKVQFIITTHSPLFLLGMKDEFDDSGFEIYQLPTGIQITAESFSEFKRAYDYMTDTQQYQKEFQIILQEVTNSKPLIITEGSTDWRHIKAAYNSLSADPKNTSLFSDMEFEFYEYDPIGDKYKDSLKQIKMGCSDLCMMCESLAKYKHNNNKIIFIADNDDAKTTNKLKSQDNRYKNWGNNVFSVLLPVPPHRKSTPLISIEHYYSDDEIKTEVDLNGLPRRLFIGNEFDERGINKEQHLFCEKKDKCGKDKINIIDGSSGERVTNFSDDSINLALPKMEFAKRILDQVPPFDKFNFDAFLDLFDIIHEIIGLPLE